MTKIYNYAESDIKICVDQLVKTYFLKGFEATKKQYEKYLSKNKCTASEIMLIRWKFQEETKLNRYSSPI